MAAKPVIGIKGDPVLSGYLGYHLPFHDRLHARRQPDITGSGSGERSARGRIVSSRRRRRCIKIQPTRCPPGCSWGSLRSQRRQELVITAHRPAVLRGRGVEFKQIGGSTDQIDLCAAAPVVGTAD